MSKAKPVPRKPTQRERKELERLLAEGRKLGDEIAAKMAPVFRIPAKIWYSRFNST